MIVFVFVWEKVCVFKTVWSKNKTKSGSLGNMSDISLKHNAEIKVTT